MMARHKSIRSRVHFKEGMPAGAVIDLLLHAGFVDPVIDRRLADIHFAQARKMPFWRALERLTSDRYAICVRKLG